MNRLKRLERLALAAKASIPAAPSETLMERLARAEREHEDGGPLVWKGKPYALFGMTPEETVAVFERATEMNLFGRELDPEERDAVWEAYFDEMEAKEGGESAGEAGDGDPSATPPLAD